MALAVPVLSFHPMHGVLAWRAPGILLLLAAFGSAPLLAARFYVWARPDTEGGAVGAGAVALDPAE